MNIAENLARVSEAIRRAEERAGRTAGAVRLVAVSKFHPAEAVIEAVRAGQTLFGENRVQEAVPKFAEVAAQGFSAELHLIGSLQRNKVKTALSAARCIQSVDRLPLAEEIEKQARTLGKPVEVLFEYHTGEASKSGFLSEAALFECLERVSAMQFVVPKGFMTMAPFTGDAAPIRESFRALRRAAEAAQKRFPSLSLAELSMGMSNDYEIAIEEGATLVRIGTAIFGARS
ncbi:YggS family pyridoxal phosphate-dependent enzyme [Treponema endosymbiont of Eucomonympha sp.]|uniref:YggS family pyridoxal phosphate-dependent enzyme n=1 Tax=Treponema endosymbiont of Eucomonympha sp. TaxID=1580831 RepID=UPI000780ED6F|nr:YggS family pyridoxal phosphate-dependent enzyme [Treponema endosymbiont of Eucomonympha sp.]